MPPRIAAFSLCLLFFPSSGNDLAVAGSKGVAGSDNTASTEGNIPNGDELTRQHADDVASYTMDARIDPQKHTIDAHGTIHFKNTSAFVQHELWIHLYLNAFKNQKSAFLREKIGQFRGQEPIEDWGYIKVRTFMLKEPSGASIDLWPRAELHRPDDGDETDVRVPVPQEIAPGESIDLEMTWDVKLPSVVERTGYKGSFHMVGQWFPKLARLEQNGTWTHFPFHHLAEFYADFGTYDVTLDAPASFQLCATGPVVEAHVDHDRRVERHVQSDVHDFAWAAWDQWQIRTENIAGVNVRVFFPQGYGRVAEREVETIRFALPYYNAHYGKYPYSVLTLVHPPEDAQEAGGMEYPTLITTGGSWYEPRAILGAEIVTIHEFGHQWFYGLLASNEERWPFLDEGINSYAEQEALTAWKGAGSAFALDGIRVSDVAVHAALSHHASHNEPIAQPADAFATGSDYGELVYGRTATILETLRRVYGESIEHALRHYALTHRFSHPDPQDLLRSFAEIAGQPVAETLRVALFEKGWADYAVLNVIGQPAHVPAGIYDQDGKQETVSIGTVEPGEFEGAAVLVRRGTLKLPVDIEMVFADGSSRRTRWDGSGDTFRVPYRGSIALRSVEVDPTHAILIDEDFTNNHKAVEDMPRTGASLTLERVAYWAQILEQIIWP